MTQTVQRQPLLSIAAAALVSAAVGAPPTSTKELNSCDRPLMGEGYFLMAEMYIADAEIFKAATKSPWNAAAGAYLANFAQCVATVMIGEAQ